MADDLMIRGRDRLQEISMKLEQSHLVYLQTDDSPLKLQQRHKLEGFIREYLCLVPNESKYVFQSTADILHRSAANVQDFSGYRAATAWSAISLYAANLLAQPWRKEYRTLRTYSGYYKHEVESNLTGAELMFEQMGYKHTGLGVLTLEGPIDPDKVSCVSRDAIVAFVECQILKQIWESVSQNFTISWLEVLQFRENHVGTVEQAIRALNHRFLEKLHQSRIKTAALRSYPYTQPTGVDLMHAGLPYHMPHSYDAPISQPECRYNEDMNMMPQYYRCFPMNRGAVNRCDGYNCWSHGNKYFPNCHTNSYCSTMPAYASRVPTGHLIELDPPVPVMNHEKMHSRKTTCMGMDEVDFQRKSDNGDYCDYGSSAKISSNPDISSRNDGYDSWDFVYKNLKSQGYSKDLGDREDILRKSQTDLNTYKQTHYKPERYNVHGTEKRKNGGANYGRDINSFVSNGGNAHSVTFPFKKKSASFDLSDSNKACTEITESQRLSSNVENRHGSQTLPMSRADCSSDEIARFANSLQDLEMLFTRRETKKQESGNRWNCATCTFLNTPDREICEMCNKSKRKGNEDKPLASGGKECPQCTLVNEKNVSKCEACGHTLKDSPTYI